MLGDSPAPRLDKALADVAPAGFGLSRSKLTRLLGDGALSHVGVVVGTKDKPIANGQYDLHLPKACPAGVLQAQAIALDVVYEDETLIVINKPAGMVVHPAPGSKDGTLVNALLHHFSSLGGDAMRPGIVHRIDKDTSGLLVIAKTDSALVHLQAQFAKHTIDRRYLALCKGVPSKADPRLAGIAGVGFEDGGIIRIATQIARHKTDRKRQAVVKSGGRHAITRARVLQEFDGVALLECQLQTGRTHQIRVHFSHIGHGLIGDPTYGRAKLPRHLPDALHRLSRQALHATHLGFIHPESGEHMAFDAPLPVDFEAVLKALSP